MKYLLTILFILLLSFPVYSASDWEVYDMDFDVEASTVEAAPEACVRRTANSFRDQAADCEVALLGAKSAYISWNSVDDALGTHASTDWSINVRCIAMFGDTYPAVGTAPTSTEYYEQDIDLDGQYGGWGLTVTGQAACKIRVDADTAAVAAPTIKFKVEY